MGIAKMGVAFKTTRNPVKVIIIKTLDYGTSSKLCTLYYINCQQHDMGYDCKRFNNHYCG